MINTGKLAGRTVFITGASRGIGKAIALKVARDGANVVIAAKTAEPHPKLPGTIFTTGKEVEAAGGKSLPCIVDVRDEQQIQKAVDEAVKLFGGIDIVINNASAISLTKTDETDMKRYDLMHQINTRGTFLVSKICLPHLKKSNHAHILNLSPPLNMVPHWFQNHVAYTMAKYGMSMCVLGMHEEFRPYNIGVNALWPRTAIATAAIEMITSVEASNYSRKPEIVADAAYAILIQDPKTASGNFYIDDTVLRGAGVDDMVQYAVDPANKDNLMPDFFVDDKPVVAPKGVPSLMQPSDEALGKKRPVEEGGGEMGTIFKAINASLSKEIVDRTQAVFQFVVTGAEAGKWFIDLKTGTGACGKGEAPSGADATLTMDSKNLAALFAGKIKPATAFMTGKLKISGNMQKALKLDKLLVSLKAKL